MYLNLQLPYLKKQMSNKPQTPELNQGVDLSSNMMYTYTRNGVEYSTPSSSIAFARCDEGTEVFGTQIG